jgi:phage terminase large subunit-like protein
MCDARGRGGQAAFCSPLQSFHRGSSRRSAFPCSSSARARRCWPRRAVVSLREDQKIFFVLGNAGSGKGTQCAKLVKKFALDHVSAGDLLRAEVASGSERGAMIAEIIKDGRLVPGHITIELLKAAIEGTYVVIFVFIIWVL